MSKHNKNVVHYYGKDRAAKSIYGAILIFVFIASMQIIDSESNLKTAIGIFAAGISIVFAEIYSEIIGMTIKQKGPITKPQIKEITNDSLAIASVSLVPTIFFALSAFKVYSIDIAFMLSYVFCLSVLLVFSYWASRLSGYTKLHSFLTAAVTTLIGIFIIVLKFMVGH